ncbi:MAG: sigma 54-interacting transcriptional regulator [Brevinematales bacterium]|nr:sigma 54-interacting transcriptional regulator [Brevinematales bacterium]
MKAEDLKLEEIIQITEGKIDFHGRRVVIHSLNAMLQLRRDLSGNIGEDLARRFLTRFGYFSGQADAAAMIRLFKWNNHEELLRTGPKLHALMGVVQPKIERLEFDPETKSLNMEIVWYHSAEAEGYVQEIGPSADPVCWIMTGYISGHASYCLGIDVYFIEDQCLAIGSPVCHIIGKDAASWGNELERIKHYYQAEDIHKKVQNLSAELKKKTIELQKQKEKLDRIENHDKNVFIEVRSKSFQKALDNAYRVAKFDSSVLITGETGTGKEVLARYIHRNSTRAAAPFIAINCAALPETLLESELFGHKAGSFTGAVKNRTGLFEEANNGTILLDEIGDITPRMQMRLLRVLQEREIMRVGENTTRKINVRAIAATNRDLSKDVADGKFREDLYYRIRVVEIELPPLRQRMEDIIPLARFFIKKLSKSLNLPRLKLDSTSLDYLLNYSWPGNVRELENILESAAIMANDQVIMPENLPFTVLHRYSPGETPRNIFTTTLKNIENEHIMKVLEHCGGNKAKTAKILGISTTTLWRHMKEMSIGDKE